MNDEPSSSTPDASSDPGFASRPAAGTVRATGPATVSRIPLWALTLGVGLASGLIGWTAGEAAYARIKMEDHMVKPANYDRVSGYEKQALISKVTGEAEHSAEKYKALFSFGVLGLVLGAGLGLVGGWAAGSGRSTMVGVVLGGLAGAAAGGAASWVAVPLYFQYENPETGMSVLFATHAAIFVGLGAACGLGLGLGLGNGPAVVRGLIGGLLGGFLGTMAVEVAIAMAFPMMRTFEPIASEPTPRLVMYLCAASLIGLSAGMAARPPRKKPLAAEV